MAKKRGNSYPIIVTDVGARKEPGVNQALSTLFFPYAGIDQIRLYGFNLRLFAEPPQKKRTLKGQKKRANESPWFTNFSWNRFEYWQGIRSGFMYQKRIV